MRMTLRKAAYLLTLSSALLLTACGGDMKEELGLKKAPPDEFSVVTRAPLSVPPDYTLRPPRPGAERPMELSVREQAKKTVFGTNDTSEKNAVVRSGTSNAFLNQLGAANADPAIRNSLDSEMLEMDKKDQPAAEKLLFWKEKEPPGKTIDPAEEKKRLEAEGLAKGQTSVEKRNEDILGSP